MTRLVSPIDVFKDLDDRHDDVLERLAELELRVAMVLADHSRADGRMADACAEEPNNSG